MIKYRCNCTSSSSSRPTWGWSVPLIMISIDVVRGYRFKIKTTTVTIILSQLLSSIICSIVFLSQYNGNFFFVTFQCPKCTDYLSYSVWIFINFIRKWSLFVWISENSIEYQADLIYENLLLLSEVNEIYKGILW